MTEIDDKLLKEFFSDNKQEIADNGFTRRVMHKLPDRNARFANIITTLCIAIALIMFFVLDGLQALVGVFREVFISIVQNGAVNFDLRTLIVVGGVLLFFGIRKIYTME